MENILTNGIPKIKYNSIPLNPTTTQVCLVLCNVHPLKVVGRGSETQLQVGDNLKSTI